MIYFQRKKTISLFFSWESFVRYLKEQILDVKDDRNQSNSLQTQVKPCRSNTNIKNSIEINFF